MGPRNTHASLMCCKKHKLPTSLPHMSCAGEFSHVVTVRVGAGAEKRVLCCAEHGGRRKRQDGGREAGKIQVMQGLAQRKG